MGQELQIIIRDWSVVGNGRLVGTVHHRPGQAEGRKIMTSPVVQVRLMGANQVPVAFTQSGSVYWLATPSDKFGARKAEAFVLSKLLVGRPPVPPPENEERTTLFRIEERA